MDREQIFQVYKGYQGGEKVYRPNKKNKPENVRISQERESKKTQKIRFVEHVIKTDKNI
ncbi:MAG: hypothetical protein F6K22_30995 [Okeania sp. SIO2F4]|uniref:hypothetical protein n=1 Tax=Okeania sp. SIO2F4 TaxID=2607790 RepID=UPI00142AE390|nr:hypothetical protein [Okeania sp. SIO2F4]NES06854.1 hypothetical protein [Okeania sp. SIO2F4]